MTSPFRRPQHTPEALEEHRKQRLTEAAIRKLEGQPTPSLGPYTGRTSQDLIAHRIREIELDHDLGWPGGESARLLIEHHSREAVATARKWASDWDMIWRMPDPGMVVIDRARDLILRLRERIDPALWALEKQYDLDGVLRREYEDMERRHLDQIEAIRERLLTRHRKVREVEGSALQVVLDYFAKDLARWRVLLVGATEE